MALLPAAEIAPGQQIEHGSQLFDFQRVGRAQPQRALAECARLEGLDLRSVFVDTLDEPPYAFGALRALLHRSTTVRTVLLADLAHVTHIPTVAHLGQAGLSRFLGAAVFINQ